MKKIKNLLAISFLISFSAFAQSPLNMTYKSNLPYPGKSLSNIWGYVDSFGNEYALVGTTAGVSIVNVTTPGSPVEVFTVSGTNSIWREIKTHGNYAYVTTEGGTLGLQIIDLSNLPTSINSKYYKGDGAINGLLNKAHALHIDNGFCYLYGTNLYGGAAVILNLASPWNPVYAGNTSLTGVGSNYIHDGGVFNDTLYGGHIYGGYFSIINVTDKANPVLLQTQNTPNNFTHNTWLSDNHKVLFTTDETSNSYLAAYDISDVNNITLLDKIQSTPGNGSVIHNTYIKNDFAVASYYTEGVAVFDAARPDNLIKVGHYDSSPLYSGNGYHGAWGVYPYLPSGNILISDIENGLYVVTPNYVRGCYFEGTVTDSLTGMAINGATVQIAAVNINETTDVTGNFKSGTVNAGTYTVIVSKTGYVTKYISGVNLNNGVLTNLNIQLSLPEVTILGNVSAFIGGTPIDGAKILFQNAAHSYEATTDFLGNYSLFNVQPGNYDIVCGKWKFNNQCTSKLITTNLNNYNFLLKSGLQDDFSLDFGWVKQSSAKKGKWERAIPVGTTFINPNDANPGNDVSSDCLNWCYVTGNSGGTATNDDVDSGYTKLTSPALDLTTYNDPVINYSRWFFASPGSKDTLMVRLIKGSTVVTIEKVALNTPGISSWVSKSFRVLDYMTKGKTIKLSFYIKDKNPDHIVEVGVDNFSVSDLSPLIANANKTNQIIDNTDFIEAIYPNPFSNNLSIGFTKNENQNVTIELIDLTGRMVFHKEYKSLSSSFELDLTSLQLQNGCYFLKLKNETNAAVIKVIRQ